MNTSAISASLTTLSTELIQGPAKSGAFILNTGDVGLLKSLDKISAKAASALTATGSSIASHTDHVRYGLSLMNQWTKGENPWDDADWSASWRRTTVSDAEWRRLREDLAAETRGWIGIMRQPREVADVEVNSMIGSIVHLAYHIGAIRQIDQAARGPKESGPGS